MMVGTGIIGSAIVLVALYLLTASLDRHATENGNRKLSMLLTEWTESLTKSVEDIASSGEFYHAVTGQESRAPSSAFGAVQNIDGSLDWFAILDDGGNLVYEFELPQQWDAAAFFAGDAYLPVLGEVAGGDGPDNSTVAGAFNRERNSFLAATTLMTSALPFDAIDDAPLFLVGGTDLDANALEEIALRTGSSSISFSENPSERAIQLEGPLGLSGFLTWDSERPGLQFRQETLPWVSLICAVFVLLTGWMASYFRRLATSLDKMHKIATTDQLTGVANRAALTEFLQMPMLKDALKNGSCAVISLDINDFKHLNDAHGHHAGDIALREAADRIRASLRHKDKVIRMGGDEFICLVFDPNPSDAAEKVVARLTSAFSAPMVLGQSHQIVTPSIGIAVSNGDESWDTILERSDSEMYKAKRNQIGQRLCLV